MAEVNVNTTENVNANEVNDQAQQAAQTQPQQDQAQTAQQPKKEFHLPKLLVRFGQHVKNGVKEFALGLTTGAGIFAGILSVAYIADKLFGGGSSPAAPSIPEPPQQLVDKAAELVEETINQQ